MLNTPVYFTLRFGPQRQRKIQRVNSTDILPMNNSNLDQSRRSLSNDGESNSSKIRMNNIQTDYFSLNNNNNDSNDSKSWKRQSPPQYSASPQIIHKAIVVKNKFQQSVSDIRCCFVIHFVICIFLA